MSGDGVTALGGGVVRVGACSNIWRGLSVLNGLLLMSPIQQRPGQLRRRTVAYIAPEFNGCIIGFVIGFAYTTVDLGGRLAVHTENNRVYFNGRPLHAPYREAPFSIRSWFVVLGLGLLRLNAHFDIWRGLSVLNGILLMSSIQQRPEQLRRRAVAYVATEFDDGIIGFAISFANAAINPGGRLVARDLGVLRFAHPDIWRGLSVSLDPDGILLMPPIQQRPEQLRWCAVAYVATEFDGYIIGFVIGFANATITPSGRLVVRNLGVVRHTYPDIRRGLLVPLVLNGILLMPSIQQRPGQFRQHAVTHTTQTPHPRP